MKQSANRTKACAMTTDLSSRAMNSACGVMEPVAMQEMVCCEIRIEECGKGCKIYCTCDDELACAALHALCRNMLDCPCSVSCTKDGVMVCRCEFDCCDCSCEVLSDGICITCKSKDKCCAEMIQTLCRCLSCCQECDCTSTVSLNKVPVCCCTCC